jgi:tetratricopeptide (TPR) repeat protein
MSDPTRIDRLLDAVELIKANRRDEARPLLRDLIREDSDFEDAWLWMSVAVDTLDQAAVCLDNVLRINPNNYEAAGALYRIRIPEMEMKKRRSALRMYRDMAISLMWIIITVIFVGVYLTYAPMMDDIPTPTSRPATAVVATPRAR